MSVPRHAGGGFPRVGCLHACSMIPESTSMAEDGWGAGGLPTHTSEKSDHVRPSNQCLSALPGRHCQWRVLLPKLYTVHVCISSYACRCAVDRMPNHAPCLRSFLDRIADATDIDAQANLSVCPIMVVQTVDLPQLHTVRVYATSHAPSYAGSNATPCPVSDKPAR